MTSAEDYNPTDFARLMSSEASRRRAAAMVVAVVEELESKYEHPLDAMLIASEVAKQMMAKRDALLESLLREIIGTPSRHTDGKLYGMCLQPYQIEYVAQLAGLSESTLRRRERVVLLKVFDEFEKAHPVRELETFPTDDTVPERLRNL